MYILNIPNALKKWQPMNERIGFAKENSYYSMNHQKKKDLLLFENKLIESISDPSNAREYFNFCLKRKTWKLHINYRRPKRFPK